MMKAWKKRIGALLLSLAMVLSLMPAGYAAEYGIAEEDAGQDYIDDDIVLDNSSDVDIDPAAVDGITSDDAGDISTSDDAVDGINNDDIIDAHEIEAYAADSYSVSVSASETEVTVGETVTLTAVITADGEPLDSVGDLNLWFWVDIWNDHTDGLSDADIAGKDNSKALSSSVTLNSIGTYYIAAELKDADNKSLAIDYVTINVTAASQEGPAEAEFKEISLPNGDFESGTENWILSGYSGIDADSYAPNNTTNTLNLWLSNSEAAEGTAAYTVKLTAGSYYFTFDLSGENSDGGLSCQVTSDSETLYSSSAGYTTTGWDKWDTCETDKFSLTKETTVTFIFSGNSPAGWWGHLDNLKLYGTGAIVSGSSVEPDPSLPKPSITIPSVEGTAGDGFMRGVDVSSLLSILNSGAHYYDFNGVMLGDANDVDSQGEAFMDFLAACGVNWVRLRVWNDPFDASKNGYGGGNNDINAAVTMGKWATDAGMRVLIDFHYSDFWADPGKQKAPKAWANFDVDEKAEALAQFTTDSLNKLRSAGVNVGMVQVGNETTGGIAGESTTANMMKLFSAGADAVRKVDPSILIAIHLTNPETSGRYASFAKNLSTYDVDYDVLASSYYPFWHGTLDNLTSVLKQVADTYGKKVIVAETSWSWTLKDGDGHTNSIVDDYSNYATSVQGQATEVAEVMQAVRDVGDAGIGVFYWEPAWIPVNNVSNLSGDEQAAQINANKVLWERYGSGWASSYAGEYDPSDAGKWYGGSSWDNQAMFDFDGKPLQSLLVWTYVQQAGTVVDKVIVSATSPTQTYYVGDTLKLPTTVVAQYNTGSSTTVSVTWNADDVAKVDMSTSGVYTVRGTVAGTSLEVICTVTVLGANLLSNPGFEDGDTAYTLTGWAGDGIGTKNDVLNGSYSLHFYSASAKDVTAKHDSVTLEAGTYSFSLYIQGDDTGTAGIIFAEDASGKQLGHASFTLSGWANWAAPSFTFTLTEETQVTVGANISIAAGGWGTLDDWYLCLMSNGGSVVTPPGMSNANPELAAMVKGLDPLDYTGASWAALMLCLEAEEATDEAKELVQYAIDNLEKKSGDMALGSDISWCAAEDSKYNNEDGVSKPMYQLITEDYGYNMVRLRTWTGNENGEVGKNTIIAYAKKCADAGLRIMIDFHYADNWADPGKQPPPAAWNVSGTSAAEADRVAQLLYDYTYDFMTSLVDAGVYPEWVQVGNEIDGGMVWDLGRTTYMSNLVKLLQAGTDAVRAASPTTKVVIHRSSGAETENVMNFYRNLIRYGYDDFDVIGLSFYPYDTDPTALIAALGDTFDGLYEEFCKNTKREIMVVEIGSNYMEGEGATRNQGYNMIVNVINLLKQIPDGRGTGCMYWEIQHYEYSGSRPNIVWKAFSPGAELINETPVTGLALSASHLSLQVNSAEALTVTYTPSKPDITALTWTSSNPEVASVSNSGLVVALSVGEAVITATAAGGSGVTASCTVTVTPEAAGLKNPGFELGDAYWVIPENITGTAKISNSDNHLAGSYSLHYAADADGLDINFYQEINGLTPGIYTLSCRVMGDKNLSTGYLTASTSNGDYTSDAWKTKDWGTTDSYWITATLENIVVGSDGSLTVGAKVSSTSVSAWGDFDEFELILVEPSEDEPAPVNPPESPNQPSFPTPGTPGSTGTTTIKPDETPDEAPDETPNEIPDKGNVPDNSPDSLPFTDVGANAWYAQAIASIYARGFMKGTSESTFEPAATLNRAMMAQIIYNMAKNPTVTTTAAFTDVAANAYYADAVSWCTASGIIMGLSNTIYGGEQELTREQMAVMLYRFVQTLNLNLTTNMGMLLQFSDGGLVSDWAQEAMSWAVAAGLFQGRDNGCLDPQANVTRAEVAVVLDRYATMFMD